MQQDKLHTAIADFMKDHHFPGVVVGAWVPGKGNYVVARGKSDQKTGRFVSKSVQEERLRFYDMIM